MRIWREVRAIAIFFVLFCTNIEGNGILYPNFSSWTHYIAFCDGDGIVRGFTSKACPGGISMLRKAIPKDTCICHHGHFLARTPLKQDKSTLAWSVPSAEQTNKCIRYSIKQNKNVDVTGDIYGLVPTLEDHVGEFDDEGNFRRVPVKWLRQHGNWTPYSQEAMGSRKLGEKSYAFWSHPRASNVQGEKINMNLRHTDGSVQNCDLRQLALQDLPKKFAMCKITTSRKIDDTWTMIPGKSKGSGGFIFESGLGKYESCNAPPKAECVVKNALWVTRPLNSDWGRLTVSQLHDRLRSEMEQLVEYRMRIELQNAHIESNNFSRALKLLDIATKIFGKKKPELPEGRNFNPDKNDMIVELLWKGVDLVHSECFRFRQLSEKQRKVYPVILPGLHEGTLEMADMVVHTHFHNTSQVYNNWLRKPMKQIVDEKDAKNHPVQMYEQINGCPKNQLIWDGEACCLQYDQDKGIFPPLNKLAQIK
ncbi:hypothetical protein Fcan01_05191 [Folsomia candida]|uniref:Uncharacterized protein n=1 Tax=Folsomia candida TaxID=158441 RepID=A0A226EWG3_FOLCA|nr:hypothetical protein Fcan01_05191 [Folsomia candida]